MKKSSLFFVAVISIVFIAGCSKTSNNSVANQINKQTILKSINSSDSLDKGYGFLEGEKVYFVSCDLIEKYDGDINLVIIEINPHTSDGEVFESFSNRETIKMDKVGKYFVGKSTKKYINPAFYFKAGEKYFPGDNPEKFKSKDLVRNQCDGILLNPSRL
ncbi:MAG: hypothetical protein WC249_01155 [Patescibacteria group bacterium]|jgi:hypothetical protein